MTQLVAPHGASTIAKKLAPQVGSRWSTPVIYKALQITIVALTAVFLLTAEASLDRARHATRTIWKDTAPSILTALELQALLADLDSLAANMVLDPDTKTKSADAFERERLLVSKRLVEASQNITFGESEKVPLITISEQLGRYLEHIGRVQLLQEKGDVDGAVKAYRQATDVMHDKLLPAARLLDSANASVMTSVYVEQVRSTRARELAAFVFGLLLLLLLLGTQVFLIGRTRRLINLPLLMSSWALVVFLVYLGSLYRRSSNELKVAREDAFQSIQALSTVRAIAYDANGDESRYLLDRDRSATYERAFFDKMYQLSSTPESTYLPGRGLPKTQFLSGKIAELIANITFSGEREAIQQVMIELSSYWKTDKKIRQLESAGLPANHKSEVYLCLGESNDAFTRFDSAIEKAIALNQGEFDRALSSADSSLRTAEMIDPFLAACIAGFAFFGLRQRLREYD
ncbi:MAG: hypothetical protein U0165_09670 [Polyangiaceae bacterium]